MNIFVSWNGCVSNREGEIGMGPTDWEKGLDCALKYLVVFEKEKKGDNEFNEGRSQKMRSRATMSERERNVYRVKNLAQIEIGRQSV